MRSGHNSHMYTMKLSIEFQPCWKEGRRQRRGEYGQLGEVAHPFSSSLIRTGVRKRTMVLHEKKSIHASDLGKILVRLLVEIAAYSNEAILLILV